MTVDNVNSAIAKLEALNPNNEYAYETAVLAYLTIKKMPIFLCNIPTNTIVFRTRLHETNDFYRTITDVAIAPKPFVKEFGRCNRPFQSKFYCSENRPTSYIELVENWVDTKNYGEKIYVTIGRWVVRPISVVIVTTPDKHNRISEFDKRHGEAMDQHIANCEPELKEATVAFYRYLFDKFRKSAKHDPKTYIITTAYCNLVLTQSQGKANGIYYPSVPFAGQGVNFAFNSDFATLENMELTHVFRNEMSISENENKNKKYLFTETEAKEAINIDTFRDSIDWQ